MMCNSQEENQLDLLTGPNQSWFFEPKHGLILKNVSLNDFGLYECVGSINRTSEWQDFAIVAKGNCKFKKFLSILKSVS